MATSDDYEAFDISRPSTWIDTSQPANERDLADLLTDDVLEWFHNIDQHQALEISDEVIHAYFTLLMMDDASYLAATGASDLGPTDPRRAHRMALKNAIYDDVNDNTGEYFTIRLRQRIEENS